MQLKNNNTTLITLILTTTISLLSSISYATPDNNKIGGYEERIYDLPLSVLIKANKLIFCTL